MSEQISQEKLLARMKQVFARLQSGGDQGPIDDRYEYERLIDSEPTEEDRQLAHALTDLADLAKYFSEHKLRMPADVVAAMSGLARLPVRERIARAQEIAKKLTEHIHDAGKDPAFRN